MKPATEHTEKRAGLVWLGIMLCAWLCTFPGGEGGLTRFTLPIMFLVIFVMPIPAAAVLKLGQIRLISFSLVCGLSALPFLTSIAMRFPSSIPALAVLAGLIGLEVYFWGLVYSRSRLFYSIGVMVTVLLPLLAGILTLNTPGMDWVFAVSPLGLTRVLSVSPAVPSLIGFAVMHIIILGLVFMAGLSRTAPMPEQEPEA
jgi:hypothetical protein